MNDLISTQPPSSSTDESAPAAAPVRKTYPVPRNPLGINGRKTILGITRLGSRVCGVRFPHREYRAVQALAAAEGLSVAGLIRLLVLEGLRKRMAP